EYVWGTEDLEDYGDWNYTDDYGWIWRPRSGALSTYSNWAPYRYGNWAWCPRSGFYRKRSWWRPALVAFVFDFSFGNDICWYPLSYYQRDPHSRHYSHGQPYRHPNDNGRPNGPGPAADYKNWRGVTRVPRSDFGNPNRRAERVDDS